MLALSPGTWSCTVPLACPPHTYCSPSWLVISWGRFLDELRSLVLRCRCLCLPSNYNNPSLRSEVKTLHSMKGLWCASLCLLLSFRPGCCFNWGPTLEAGSEILKHPAVRKLRFDCSWMKPLMSVCFEFTSPYTLREAGSMLQPWKLHLWQNCDDANLIILYLTQNVSFPQSLCTWNKQRAED